MHVQTLDEFALELASHHETFKDLFNRMGYVPLLPLLEFPYAEVVSRFQDAFISAGIPASQIAPVSLNDLALFALREGSAYWISLALKWLESGCEINVSVFHALIALSGKKANSQQTRHLAFRLAQRWKRKNQSA